VACLHAACNRGDALLGKAQLLRYNKTIKHHKVHHNHGQQPGLVPPGVVVATVGTIAGDDGAGSVGWGADTGAGGPGASSVGMEGTGMGNGFDDGAGSVGWGADTGAGGPGAGSVGMEGTGMGNGLVWMM